MNRRCSRDMDGRARLDPASISSGRAPRLPSRWRWRWPLLPRRAARNPRYAAGCFALLLMLIVALR